MKGSTKLYVPNEDLFSIEEARKEKDLIQRLESSMIHWTSQIKEVVQERDIIESENARPLSEIEYWRSRASDLKNILSQIQQPDLQQIIKVLSNSSYLEAFEKAAGEIESRCAEAEVSFCCLESYDWKTPTHFTHLITRSHS